MTAATARSSDVLARKFVRKALPEDWQWKVAARAAKPLVPEAMALRAPLRVRQRTAYAVEATIRAVLNDATARSALETKLARLAGAELDGDVPRKKAEAAFVRSATTFIRAWIDGRLPVALRRARAAIAAAQRETDLLFSRIERMDARALHRFANRHNWDEGIYAVDAVVRHPQCALGTALLVYWLTKPYWHTQWRTAAAAKDPETFAMLAHIEAQIARNGYAHAGIAFDPRKEELTSDTYAGTPKKRALPAHVFAATTTKDVIRFDPPGARKRA